jgi:hypothetical protein
MLAMRRNTTREARRTVQDKAPLSLILKLGDEGVKFANC